MTQDALEALGQRVEQFLRDAMAGLDPKREIARSEAIMADLGRATEGRLYSPGEWSEVLDRVVRPVVQSFGSEPESWTEAVRLARIYLTKVPPPGTPAQSPDHAGTIRNPVDARLDQALLRGLLESTSTTTRMPFLASIQDRYVMQALAAILDPSSTALSVDELTVLWRQLEETTRGDGVRPWVMDPLGAWVMANPDTGKAVVESWFAGTPPASDFDMPALGVLIETLARVVDRDWVDDTLRRLEACPHLEVWRTLAWLACFAWPEGTPVSRRHEALVAQVRRLPAQLIDAGLRALSRDAWEHPTEAAATGVRLLDLLSVEMVEERAPFDRAEDVGALVYGVLGGADRNGSEVPAELLDRMLDIAVEAPPSPGRHGLDSVLAHLWKSDPGRARRFVERWVARHGRVLVQQHLGLGELFPLLWDHLGHVGQMRLLVDLALVSDRGSRTVAVGLFGIERSQRIPAESVDHLTGPQVRALVHELAAGRFAWVRAVADIARARHEVTAWVGELLAEEGTEAYPGECGRIAQQWKAALEAGDVPETLQDALARSVRSIQDALDARERVAEATGAVPELWATRPAGPHAVELHDRQLKDAMQEHERSGRSMVSLLVKKVHIIYGGASRVAMPGTGHTTPETPFQRLHWEQEWCYLESVDPIGAMILRLAHRQEAARILDAGEEAAP